MKVGDLIRWNEFKWDGMYSYLGILLDDPQGKLDEVNHAYNLRVLTPNGVLRLNNRLYNLKVERL